MRAEGHSEKRKKDDNALAWGHSVGVVSVLRNVDKQIILGMIFIESKAVRLEKANPGQRETGREGH